MTRGLLNRHTLHSNGITFNRNVVETTELREILGEEAASLATRLLDFHRFAPQERAKPLMASADRSLSRRLNEELDEPAKAQALKKLKAKALGAHTHAMRIVVASEERWMILVKELFEDIITRARDVEGVRRIGARQLAKSLRIDAGGGLIWNAAHEVRLKTAPADAAKLTRPKPDLFISLPTFEEHKVPRGFAREPGLENFSVEKLRLLEDTRDVVTSPLRRMKDRRIDPKHRLCFPCVVLEAKHHEVSNAEIEKCFCQAANGAASALALLDDLTWDYTFPDVKREIRPVIAITLNGHKTRVWIAAIKSRKMPPEQNPVTYYHMQCIWKGDLNFEEPVMELICIIDSLEEWALDDFRPWVSGYLGRHYLDMGLDVEYYNSTDDSSSEEEGGNDSEVSDELESTDDEEREWDENWVVSESEESSSSGVPSDDEDYLEYVKDINRADSLLAELSFDDSSSKSRRASHTFMKKRGELGIE